MKFYTVYILLCIDNSYYVGISSELDNRIVDHNSGRHPKAYTHSRRPVVLKFFEHFTDVNQAIYFEKKIKRWSRAKKKALIDGDFDRLQYLAECRNATHHKYKPGSD